MISFENLFPHLYLGISLVEMEEDNTGESCWVLSIGLIFVAINIAL